MLLVYFGGYMSSKEELNVPFIVGFGAVCLALLGLGTYCWISLFQESVSLGMIIGLSTIIFGMVTSKLGGFGEWLNILVCIVGIILFLISLF